MFNTNDIYGFIQDSFCSYPCNGDCEKCVYNVSCTMHTISEEFFEKQEGDED